MHDPLCELEGPREAFCVECASIETIREDERYRVVEQIMALPQEVSVEAVVDAVLPIQGDPLRRNEPRADLGYGE